MLNMRKVVARDLPDLWFQALYEVLEHGRRFVVDKGSYEGQTRLEFDYFTGHVIDPGHGSGTPEILPDIPPAFGLPNPVEFAYVYGGEGYERSYIEYVMTDAKQPGEQYTYGERLCRGHVNVGGDDWIPTLDQIKEIIHVYKKHGHRNNQMVLQIAQPSDLLLSDPPCLRQIDTRIQDGALHFFVYFRSWDLWGGLPANLAGIQALKEHMASEIGVNDGEMVVESKGLHLYGYAEKLAKIRCMLDDDCIVGGKDNGRITGTGT